jgi:hypothetical protein
MLFGRLRPGSTALQASAELNAIDLQLAAEHGSSPEITSPIVVEQVRGIPNPGNRRRARTVATLLAAVPTEKARSLAEDLPDAHGVRAADAAQLAAALVWWRETLEATTARLFRRRSQDGGNRS